MCVIGRRRWGKDGHDLVAHGLAKLERPLVESLPRRGGMRCHVDTALDLDRYVGDLHLSVKLDLWSNETG